MNMEEARKIANSLSKHNIPDAEAQIYFAPIVEDLCSTLKTICKGFDESEFVRLCGYDTLSSFHRKVGICGY